MRAWQACRQHGNRYRVHICVNGARESAVLDTRKEAAQWALEREAELAGKKLPDRTLLDAMHRYAREVSETRAGGRWERIRLTAFERLPMASRRLAGIGPDDIADWRDSRLAEGRSPGTVAREMNLMRAVFEVARREWRWGRDNPMKDVRWPRQAKGRARRIGQDEVEVLARAFGVWDKLRADTATQRFCSRWRQRCGQEKF